MPSPEDRSQSHSRASPTCWATRQHASRITNSRFLEVSGLRVRYIGPGTEDKDAASVRADCCVPFGSGIYYFEIEVLNKGRNGFVGVGFSAADVSLDRLPGWEPHSFGYHGDDGHAFHHSGKGQPYGPTFGTGDVVGVILNRAESTIAYTKNGMYLGVAFRDVQEERLYPTVGMRTPDEEILANFGGSSFKGAVDTIMANACHKIRKQIASCGISSSKKGPRTVEQLVFDYLRHQGYWQAAARAGADLLSNVNALSKGEMQDIQTRRQISESIVSGDVDIALGLLDDIAPLLLRNEPRMHFRLQCQKFMGMIRAQRVDAALEFGQTVVGPLVQTKDDQDLLQEALTLLAHSNPVDCPSYHHLLGEDALSQLAASVNAAVLQYQGRPKHSCLERIVRQLEVVKEELLDRGVPAAALVDFDSYIAH